MTADQVWDLTETVERRAYLDVAMSCDPEDMQGERAGRNATKMVSVLISVATLLAVYDVFLVVHAAH